MTTTQHYFDLATILSFLIGTVLPILVAMVTRVTTHPAIKGGVLLFLSAGTGVIAQWVDALNSNTPFAWQPVVLSALGAFLVGVTAHTAIWKSTPLSNSGTPFLKVAPKAADRTAIITGVNMTGQYDNTGVSVASDTPTTPDATVVGSAALPAGVDPVSPAAPTSPQTPPQTPSP